ncbi:iron-containing alcohol dehydrogenase [Candidatus Gastranaerophilus sp. (ex Termes propinquus)]|nr:iron-containing alcohol dehydrogenase [Candidatus Gastranaerophilus sp. (ex Termes propinquus)]
MENFEYCCPTRVVFGKGTIARVSELIDKSKKVLVLYGGGSIKKNGVYEQVMKALSTHTVLEFSGIEPNPTYETCMGAVDIIKKEGADFLLAVGGGSVLDGTKFIAAAAKFDINSEGLGGSREPWDILSKETPLKDALPLGSVITLPATGSEMNANSVISRTSTQEKLAFADPHVYPQFSIIDPETTYSLPTSQTINGIVDTFVHVAEQYATYDVNTPLQDSWALGLLRTLISEAPKILENPNDYDARANIFWCATCGLNYWMSLGCVQDWSTHMIGHELTAFYGLDHGQTLAIVLPRLWESQRADKCAKLAKMAREVYGFEGGDDSKACDWAILKTEEFFNSIGQKTKLKDYDIESQSAAELVSERIKARGAAFGERETITSEVIAEIIKNC